MKMKNIKRNKDKIKLNWIVLSEKATPIWSNDRKTPMYLFKIHS